MCQCFGRIACASDLGEMPAPVSWQDCAVSVESVPVIWQNCLYVEEHASDLAELPAVPVIWQNCLSVDGGLVIWQNCLCQ